MLPVGVVTAPKLPNDNSDTSAVILLNSNTVNTPLPAGIDAPVNNASKPRTTPFDPVETTKPDSSASPPEALDKSRPLT